jgi:hypothetical protein
MRDTLILSFQRVSFHQLQLIYYGNEGLESYEYLEACSHQWQVLPPSTVGNTSMSLDRWILQVFDLNTFIHTCKNVLGALIPTFIISRLSRIF